MAKLGTMTDADKRIVANVLNNESAGPEVLDPASDVLGTRVLFWNDA